MSSGHLVDPNPPDPENLDPEVVYDHPVTPYVIDFNFDWNEETQVLRRGPKSIGPIVASASDKQLRARARRNALRAEESMSLMAKPVDEWDNEELARGQPRNKNGQFGGRIPKWVTPAVKEEAQKRFGTMVKQELNFLTNDALDLLQSLMQDDSMTMKGQPLVSASVKADVAKFLIEHAIGKPTTRIENDISVKLQGLLGAAIIQPDYNGVMPQIEGAQASVSHTSTESFTLPSLGNPIDVEAWEDDDDD